jgi:hypothetical protein
MRNIEIKLEIGTFFTKPYGDGLIRTSNPREDLRIDPHGHLVDQFVGPLEGSRVRGFEVRIHPSP